VNIIRLNRFQVTHATQAIYGPGYFIVFDVTGLTDPQFVQGYDNAIWLRDTLRAAGARRNFKVVA
jgi:hypothetical protein